MFDLHRHDEFSLFDGFGSAESNAKYAKELGYTSLGIANHGNTHGLVQHYFACKENGIKPILGVEAYFQPKLNKNKKQYHLCLFATNLKGYYNINRLMRIGEEQRYYHPIITFEDLENASEGLLVSSACIAGFLSQCIQAGNIKLAYKVASKFKEIFDDNFYIEIQPYKLMEKGLQEKVNIELMKLAKKLNIKCILTSDSHYANPDDWDTYLKMHQIKGTEYDVGATYKEHYMPTEEQLVNRFIKMHKNYLPDIKHEARKMLRNMQELEAKVEGDILEQLLLQLPQIHEGEVDSFEALVKNVKQGLKQKGKWSKEYWERCKEELKIIKHHGFADYFLIVADYVNWAKKQGIAVGPGRGSVCNSEVAYALGITDVDSLQFGLDFRRFLREDKKKLPDIDLDFEKDRRDEVIEYIVNKYQGHSAQIRSYGLYKVDNLINDLVKVCGVDNKTEIKALKKLANSYVEDGILNVEALKKDKKYEYYNKNYDNILHHFIKMYKKVRYIGTHAAGVAITGGNIEQYTALKPDAKTGKIFTAYDLADLEKINVIKFDILGLNTMSQIKELRELTGKIIDDSWYEDKRIYEEFRKGNTDGVFQFEKDTAKEILRNIKCDCFEDVIAASSMNRPGPLSLGMPEKYAQNKFNQKEAMKSKYWNYTKETYGTIIYQEQIQQICVNIGKMSWEDADKVMKILKGGAMTEEGLRRWEKDKNTLKEKFVSGAVENGFTKKEAEKLFESMVVYSFNKGHGTGYSIISLQEMYYKIYYPTIYWYVKMKYNDKEDDRFKYSINAVKDGALVFLPHVNYTADYSLRKMDGEYVIQEGLVSIKGVGEKAAAFIEAEKKKNGKFKNIDDFIERCKIKGSPVNKGVIEKLIEAGALEFNKKIYLSRVTKYNSTLYMKAKYNN